jgi:CheY-like chemotaxis protein
LSRYKAITINVLIADHNAWTRQTVSRMLGEAGMTVELASNGMSALRIATAAQPHVVLIGPQLPEVASTELVRELRANPRTRHAAVVAIDDESLDCDGHAMLPCSAVDLLATVVRALETHRAALAPVTSRVAQAPRRPVPVARVRSEGRFSVTA